MDPALRNLVFKTSGSKKKRKSSSRTIVIKTLSLPYILKIHMKIRQLQLQIKEKQLIVTEDENHAREMMKQRTLAITLEPKLHKFRELMNHQRQIYLEDQRVLKKRHKHIMQASELIKNAIECNHMFDKKLIEGYESYNADRQQLQVMVRRLKLRRHKMCRQLLHIFPFRTVRDATNTQNVLNITYYQIRNMSLPSRADKLLLVANVGGEKEEKMAIGLGYIAHLCTLLSRYMQIPLRHTIICRGSRSRIVDAFVEADTFAAKRENRKSKLHAEYPLYSKNEDKSRFYHAIRLLQENICQLCTHTYISDYEPAAFIHNIRTVLYDMALARF